VIPVVVGSSPIGHPTFPRKWQPPQLDCGGIPGAACATLASAALAQMAANVAGAIDGHDPEYLHQLRVGIRRLRAVLRVFRKVTRKSKRLERALHRLVPALGEARDWDVFVARFGRGKARQRLAQARCRLVLESAEFRAFFVAAQRWAHLNAQAGEAPLAAFAAKALDRLHRKTLKQARRIDWRDEKRRHAARIAIRRLRYACDFFSPCFDGARRYLRGLSDLQDLLGDLNDIAVARRIGGARLEAALNPRERALVRELAPAWQAFEKRRRFWADKGRPPAPAR
jgi:triphosphatase